MNAALWVAIFVVCVAPLRAAPVQELAWPDEFMAPESVTEIDSSRLIIGTRQDIFGGTISSKDSLRWALYREKYSIEQAMRYELSRRYGTQYQFMDLSGKYVRSSFLGRAMTLGLEWQPWLNLMERESAPGWFQATTDIGPVWNARVAGVPLELKGGFSARGWNENIPGNITETKYADFHGSPGFYGGIAVGGPDRLVDSIPLYLSMRAFGRSVEDAGFAVALGSVFYGQGLPSGDSLFIYLSDSVSNGRLSYLSEGAEGKTRSINTPWRLDNSLHAAGALKGATRIHLTPALIYRLRQNLVSFPQDAQGLLNDRLNTAHTVSAFLETDTLLFFRYRGGIAFLFEHDDWLFRHTVSDTLNAANIDSVRKNNEDYDGTGATMVHALELPLPKGMNIVYSYFIDRRSKVYLNECKDSTVLNYDDNDRQRQVHDLAATLVQSERWKAGVSGRYVREVLNYVSGLRSSRNRTDRGYQVQGALSYTRGEKLVVSEVLSAEANVAEYQYPLVHQGPSNCPPYSRRFTSLLSVYLALSEKWSLSAKWNETYWDEGKWYGKEYFVIGGDSLPTPETFDYYAIERKSTEYRVELGLGWSPSQTVHIKAGAALQDIFQREFSVSGYATRHYGQGYILQPYIGINAQIREKILVRAHVERYINTYDEKIWSWKDNWDAKLYIGASF